MRIAARGGFNSGRMYSGEGQRIYWALRSDGWLFFSDIDRMIDGWIVIAGDPSPFKIMWEYDAGRYEYLFPGQSERNPSVPEGFDFGAKLRL